ncbi:MAG: hypothetical protein U9P70_00655 [Patescibacteria group bacterium]|nr:hypothetical protein [Patescibacteria group bacterium]
MIKLKNKSVIIEYSLVIIGLTMLTLVFFIDILSNFSSAIIGDGGDGVVFLWNFWWIKESIWELHQNPLICDYMFYPYVMDLRLHTLILAPALIMLPAQILWGSIVALNAYVLISFVLAGLGTYLLSKLYIKSKITAFLGAIIYAFNTYVISHTYGHFNLTTTWPIPFIIYFLEKLYNTKETKYAFYSSFSYIFLVYSDLQYAIFTALLIILWLIWKILIIIKNKQSICLFVKPLLFFTVFLMVGLYPLFSLITSGLNNNLSKPTQEAVEFYSPDILSCVIPPQGTITNDIIASHSSQLAQISFSGPEWATYMGLVIIILFPFVIFRTIRKRENGYIFWLIIFFVFFILSLGPELHYFANQNTGIALPFSYIQNFPLLNMTRVPVRILIIAILAISILIAWLLSNIRSVKIRYIVTSLFIVICIGELFLLPVYVQKLELPKAYTFLEKRSDFQKTDESIIEFPLFFTDRIDLLGKKETIFLFYQTAHEYKIINGYLSYTPQNFLKQYINMPGMLFLIEPLSYEKPQGDNLAELEDFLYNKANVKYAIIHKRMLDPVEFDYLSKFLQLDLSGNIVYNDQDIIIYELNRLQ